MSAREVATIETQNQEYTILDRNITSDEIAFSSFSGMMGFGEGERVRALLLTFRLGNFDNN